MGLGDSTGAAVLSPLEGRPIWATALLLATVFAARDQRAVASRSIPGVTTGQLAERGILIR